jgi:hypothetical protein
MMKKGQGALEFLMTYGWAFLVILIMIGALAYFGVLNPSRFLPDRCDFGTQVLCKGNQFSILNNATNTLRATLTNNAGTNMMIYGMSVTSDVPGVACSDVCFMPATGTSNLGCGTANSVPIDTATAVAPVTWVEGNTSMIVADCTGADNLFSPGEKTKIRLSYSWFSGSAGATYAKTTNAEVYAQIADQ